MAIVRHVKTNKFYRYLGNNQYTNLFTGVTGEVLPEHAQRIFKINLDATEIFNEYPILDQLVARLKLGADVGQVLDYTLKTNNNQH